jgi:hypothetical protein
VDPIRPRKATEVREWQSLSHVRWYCRYHAVFVPNYRKAPALPVAVDSAIVLAFDGTRARRRLAGSWPLLAANSLVKRRLHPGWRTMPFPRRAGTHERPLLH